MPVYGKSIFEQRPFKAELIGDSVWNVVGTFQNKNTLGGVASVVIRKRDGSILEMTHGQ